MLLPAAAWGWLLRLAHQGDAVDPALAHWLKDRLDAVLGLGPWAAVGVAAVLIAAAPLAMLLLYYGRRRGEGA